MRKTFGVFLSMVLAASMLAGCGGATGAATSQNTEETVEAEAATTEEAVEAGAEAEADATEAEAGTEAEAVQAVDANEMLSLWNEDAEARQQLISYMEAITKEDGPDFIPVENRIAVFDFDGNALPVLDRLGRIVDSCEKCDKVKI